MSKRIEKMKRVKAKKPAAPKPAPFVEPATALVLRNVAADRVSRGTDQCPHPDFTWPALGPVDLKT